MHCPQCMNECMYACMHEKEEREGKMLPQGGGFFPRARFSSFQCVLFSGEIGEVNLFVILSLILSNLSFISLNLLLIVSHFHSSQIDHRYISQSGYQYDRIHQVI